MSRTIQATDDSQVEAFYSRLSSIYEQIRRERRVEVFGMLDFEVVKSIDGKKQRIAKLKGNKILVHVNARRLPKSALKYIIAHEIAHTLTKRHSKRFWEIVEVIYPTFETGQGLLNKHGVKLLELG
jgi:Zn-dependent peptidase ImmA (M78 family)